MTRTSKVPSALNYWKHVLGAPKTGSIEKRAEQLIVMFKAGKANLTLSTPQRAPKTGITPQMMRVLALELLYACISEGYDPPESVTRLMNLVLGLPEEHEPGDWDAEWFTKDGRRNADPKA